MIVHYPHPALSTRAEETVPSLETSETAEVMLKILRESRNGVGLAANQIGVLKRIAVFQTPGLPDVMLNPVVLTASGEAIDNEGCLSLPGCTLRVKRATSITVRYQQLDGEEITRDFVDFPARVIQHEIDHLDGIVIIQKREPELKGRASRR